LCYGRATRNQNPTFTTETQPGEPQPKPKTFDPEEQRTQRIGGMKNNFNTEEPEKKNLRT